MEKGKVWYKVYVASSNDGFSWEFNLDEEKMAEFRKAVKNKEWIDLSHNSNCINDEVWLNTAQICLLRIDENYTSDSFII